MTQQDAMVLLDLNNPVFHENWLGLDKTELIQVAKTLNKLRKLSWSQVYQDAGLKWEKITSVKPPKSTDAVYSLRITQSRPATAFREGDFMRYLTLAPDHDATCGKK